MCRLHLLWSAKNYPNHSSLCKRLILSIFLFPSLCVCTSVCACVRSCARACQPVWVCRPRSALGSLSSWMPKAHTETDTGNSNLHGSLFLSMANQLWLVNGNSHHPWRQTTKSQIESPTYQFPTVSHSGAHGENEGEKPWPKPVGLQRAGWILWPANGWVNRRLKHRWMLYGCLQTKDSIFKLIFWKSPVTSGGFELSQPVHHSSHHQTKNNWICFYICLFVGYCKFVSLYIFLYFNFQLPW